MLIRNEILSGEKTKVLLKCCSAHFNISVLLPCMKITFSKYHGTGNDFILIDDRSNSLTHLQEEKVKSLCDRRTGIGADGLLLFQKDDRHDFKMVYFNADGRLSSMCGNGGRCMAAFARKLGMNKDRFVFTAADGLHEAVIEKYDSASGNAQVSLKMNDVKQIESSAHHVFIDTGSPHYITFVNNVEKLNVDTEGKKIRFSDAYAEHGVNVNFIEVDNGVLKVRTYERGVEGETLSCGTGVTASALATAYVGKTPPSGEQKIITPGGKLSVAYRKNGLGFTNIWLKGPAAFVFDGVIEIHDF